VEVVGEAADGAAAVEAIRSQKPDLVLLDIRMPGLDGFGVIREVGTDRMPQVVFVTAYDEYALKAFEVQALDYLLKPVSPSRFKIVLDRVRERLTRDHAEIVASRLDALLDRVAAKPPAYLQRIMVQEEDRAFLLRVEQIDWFEASRNYVRLHAGPTAYLVRQPIGVLAERLDPAKFLRISRSNIVRLDAVKEFQTWFHGDYRVVLKNGTELTWSRRYRARAGSDLTL
jgi:two-component system LytT family response regulator